MAWRRLSRRVIYKTPYVEVFEDTVEVEPGKIVDDYSVVTFKDGIVIVATDEQGRVIVIDEYKYGANQVMRSIPCGSIEQGEDPLEAALRELEEETGYTSTEAEYVGAVREYSSKLTHVDHIVRVKNAKKTKEPRLEITETIDYPEPISVEEALTPGTFASANVVAGIFFTLAQEKS